MLLPFYLSSYSCPFLISSFDKFRILIYYYLKWRGGKKPKKKKKERNAYEGTRYLLYHFTRSFSYLCVTCMISRKWDLFFRVIFYCLQLGRKNKTKQNKRIENSLEIISTNLLFSVVVVFFLTCLCFVSLFALFLFHLSFLSQDFSIKRNKNVIKNSKYEYCVINMWNL